MRDDADKLLMQLASFARPLLGYVSMHRFRRARIGSSEDLTEFLASRSAYISQTSLFGYLKTRMGTRFRDYFEDDEFSRVIHKASICLYASCLSDLTVFSVGLVAEATALNDDELSDLADNLFAAALYRGVADRDRLLLPEGAIDEFCQRSRGVTWPGAAQGEQTFAGSINDLIRFAPVVDEFKELDREIVRNSIRFRWRDVRDQLRRRISPDDIVA